MKTLIYSMLLASVLGIVSCGKKTENDSKEIAEDQNKEKFDDKDEKKDAKFAVAAADGALLEIKLGELAMSNGKAEEVKTFAKTMIDDHGRANAELGAMAEKKQITVPTSLSEENQKKYDDLAAKKGEEFDKAYAEFMVNDHQEDIDEFKKQAESGTDPELREWAAKKVPTLEHHLMMAENANKAVNGKAESGK